MAHYERIKHKNYWRVSVLWHNFPTKCCYNCTSSQNWLKCLNWLKLVNIKRDHQGLDFEFSINFHFKSDVQTVSLGNSFWLFQSKFQHDQFFDNYEKIAGIQDYHLNHRRLILQIRFDIFLSLITLMYKYEMEESYMCNSFGEA